MKTHKIIMLTTIIIGIITLLLAICFYYGINTCFSINIARNLFVADILVGFFSGAILSFATALILFLSERRKHIRELFQALLSVRSDLLSYANLKGVYTHILESELLLSTKIRVIGVYDTTIEECNSTIELLLTEDICTKELKNEIISLMSEINEQIKFMKPALEAATIPNRVGILIDGQKDNIISNDFTSKVGVMIQKVAKKYYKSNYSAIKDKLDGN